MRGRPTSLAVISAAMTAAALTAVVAVAGRASATAGAVTFGLSFSGSHAKATFPSPNGLQHQGPFTSTDPRCPSGYAADTAIDARTATATRRFTCSNGDGFVARVEPLPAEHGGNGTWNIVAGTGALADLRGRGTWTSTLVSGSDDDPVTVTFTSNWQGKAADDAVGPAISVSRATAHRRTPVRATVKVALSLRDDTPPVRYDITLSDARPPGRVLFHQTAPTSGEPIRFSRAIRVRHTTRTLILAVSGIDDVGNRHATTRRLKLRSR